MEVEGSGFVPGAHIRQAWCDVTKQVEGGSQYFAIEPVEAAENRIRTGNGTDFCIVFEGGVRSPGVLLVIQPCSNGTVWKEDLWNLVQYSDA
jgi:hypothetical protein